MGYIGRGNAKHDKKLGDGMQSEARSAGGGGANAGSRRGVLKSPIDLAGGLFLLAMGALGYLGTANLSFGSFSSIGPGLMPRTVSVMVAALGLTLAASAFVTPGSQLERWRLRAPLFVLGSVLVFAWTVRPLGLIVAGPLAMILSSFAEKDTRPVEIVIFATVMTAFCIGLFSFALRLPIPVLPTALPWPFGG